MKKILLPLLSLVLISFFSCNKDESIEISPDDVELLKTYVDHADSYISIAEEFDTDASAIFDAVVFSVDCDGGGASLDVQQEGRELLNDLLKQMDHQTPRQIHAWMVRHGKLMYDLRIDNMSRYQNETEFVVELACEVFPDIRTRNETDQCSKDQLVSLFRNTLAMGRTYGVTFNKEEDQRVVTDVICVARGSALNKLWNYLRAMSACQ